MVCPPAAGTPCVICYSTAIPVFPSSRISGGSKPRSRPGGVRDPAQPTTQFKDRHQQATFACALTLPAQSGGKVGKSVLIEVGNDGILVFRARQIFTYSDGGGGGSYDACPVGQRASTKG